MGCNRITIKRITDLAIPLQILSDETIASEIYEDGAQLDVPDIVHEYWLSAALDEKIIGCYRIHSMGAVLWQIHARILPEYRQKWALKASKKLLIWAADNIPNIQRIMCFVPVCHKNVALHCSQVGFRRNGTLQACYVKDGQLIDQDVYSIDKEKMNSFKLLPDQLPEQ